LEVPYLQPFLIIEHSSTFTIAWLCWDQAGNNFISQAGQMKTDGIPNDMLYFLNPIVLVVLIPCFEKGVYPFLRARGAKLDPLMRIFIGFIILTLSMIYVAALQAIIYHRGPCYEYPRACPGSLNGTRPNDISAFAQVPVYILQSIAEIFSQIAVTEYAYSKAPASMKSMMQAIAQSFGAVAAILGIGIAPVSRDPLLVIVYACLAGAMAVMSTIFWFCFVKQRCENSDAATISKSASESDSELDEGRKVIE
jgi:proton-dependent oligopeptide transporter, POT family